MLIHDPEGKQSIDLPLSDKQRALLEAGEAVTITYHTPQLMRGLVEVASGQITFKQHDGRISASDPAAFRKFKALREAIAGVQKQRETK